MDGLVSSNQHFSFYDLIVTKARGKSGPLFHFDVHDDIRLVHDTRIEKDESHPGKVSAGDTAVTYTRKVCCTTRHARRAVG